MAATTPNLGLKLWNSNSDPFNPSELANNFTLIDNQFSAVSVSTVPIRFIEPLASLPVTSLSNGRLVYLTAANGGFPANTVVRYNGTRWEVVGPPDIQSALPTSGNFQGRVVILSAAVSGFAAWDIVINTDGANTWQKVGGVVTASTVAGFTNNFAGKLGVLTSADSGFDAYTLLVYNGSVFQRVDTRGVFTGTTLPGSPYQGQVFALTAAASGFNSNDVVRYDGSAWAKIGPTVAQYCSLTITTPVTFTDTAAHVITWDTETSDTLGWHSTSSNTSRIIPTINGVYRVSTTIDITDSPDSRDSYLLRLIKNGSTEFAYLRQGASTLQSSFTHQGFQISGVIALNGSSDYVELEMTHVNPGNTNNMTVGTHSYLNVFRIGT